MKITSILEETALPVLFREGLRVAQTEQQKDMLLLSLLTAAGYALPKTYVRHGLPAHKYYANLMTVVVAPPASGKGIMNLSRRLLQPIHDEKRRLTELAAEAAAMADSDEHVPEQMAMLPANSSSNAFLHLLNDNDGRAIMIETEMDVLSATWRRDYGNYSAAFRQAFEHETISKARKVKGELLTEVKNPQLSVLLSGTPGQLYPLLVSRENGLASRLLCYVVEQIVPFREEAILKHSEQRADEGEQIFSRLADELYAIYHWLNDQEQECEWRLTDEQAEELRGCFHDNYQLLQQEMQLPLSFDSVIKRLPITILRIGMILSMVRYWEEQVAQLTINIRGKAAYQLTGQTGEDADLQKNSSVLDTLNSEPGTFSTPLPPVPAELVCSDADFAFLRELTYVLLAHAMTVHDMLPSEEDFNLAEDDEQEATTDVLLEALPKQFGRAEAIAQGEKMGISVPTVDRRIKLMVSKKQIARLSAGHFMKI